MICSSCGTENKPGRKFCSNCAAPLAAACPSCGFLNDPGDRFCGECAFALATGATPFPHPQLAPQPQHQTHAPSAERRLVSVLFADLVGFTALSEARDAEAVRELLTQYFEAARAIVERYGGVIEKFIGDAVMAVWGTPIAHEDDAERAVRAALDLVEAVRRLGETTKVTDLALRAGVLTGEAAVTFGAEGQGMVAGDLVNTASRLQSIAPSGAVLVGEATQRAAASAIVFEPAGDQTLKGKTAPVAAFRALRVVAKRGGIGRSESLEAPFVGREPEIRLLKELFHTTGMERRLRLVSIVGQAGIGKSRLVWEFHKYVDGLVEDIYWHQGRSPAYGEGITFWALGEMVRKRAGLAETDDEATTRTRIGQTVREYVTDEADRRWIEPALQALLGLEEAPSGEREELFAAWRTFFERVAAKGTVALVFEDLQWADGGLLDFIDHLLEWSKNQPIYIVTLARPELLDRRPTWGAGQRTFTSIALEPFAEPAMRDLLAGLVPGLPEPAIRSIVDRAEGVPLYAVETVRMLVAQGKLEATDGSYRPSGDLSVLDVPETLHALIAARLDVLDPADRSLLQDAAVLGLTFTVSSLAAISGESGASLEPRLRALVRRELLRLDADPRSPERGQFGFVQGLIREVAYGTLTRKDRRTRHLAAARYFESLGDDELAGALATHFVAAYRASQEGPEAEAVAAQARVALRGAADRAARLGSHDQAIAFLDQALSVTTEEIARAELLERAGRSAAIAGRSEMAKGYLTEAIDLYRAAGYLDGLARSTAELARGLLLAGYAEPAIELLERTLQETSSLREDPAVVVLMSRLARGYSMHDEPVVALDWAEKAGTAAERLDLIEQIADNLMTRTRSLFELGRPREAMVLIKGAAELAQTYDLTETEQRARTLLTFRLVYDDPSAGLVAARAGLEIAQRLGSREYAFGMLGNGAACAFRVGEWDWAIETLTEWLGGDVPPSLELELAGDLAILQGCRGEDTAALLARLDPLVVGLSDPQYESYRRLARGWIALCEACYPDAQREALAAAETTSIFRDVGYPLAGRAALWGSNAEAARRALAALEAAGVHARATAADRDTMRGGIAALEGRTADALSGYADAARQWRDLGANFDLALCNLDLVTLVGPGEGAARVAAEEARGIFEQLGAKPFLGRLEAALNRQDARGLGRAAAVPAERGAPA